MSKTKKLYIRMLLCVIAALCIWFSILDFSRFAGMDYTYDIFPSAMLKRINIILAVLVVWAAGKDGLGAGDGLRMKGAFFFALLGEALFVMRFFMEGVLMFALCQALLTIRNGMGIRNGFKLAGAGQKLILAILGTVLLVILAVFTAITGVLGGYSAANVLVYSYGIILSISLWTAVAAAVLELLPKKNARMAACGMVCFFFCDICVGLDAFLPQGLPWLLANSFIWVFYIPALVLLALSCYRY